MPRGDEGWGESDLLQGRLWQKYPHRLHRGVGQAQGVQCAKDHVPAVSHRLGQQRARGSERGDETVQGEEDRREQDQSQGVA